MKNRHCVNVCVTVGRAVLGLHFVCGSGRGVHHSDADNWAISVLVSLCWSVRCKASL